MIAREANVLLTKAALLDPRMKRTARDEQADMAEAWAEALTAAGVSLEQAVAAVLGHYSTETRPVMVADVVRLAGVELEREMPERADWVDVDAEMQRLAVTDGRDDWRAATWPE